MRIYNNYHNSKQKNTQETPQNTPSTGKSPVGESSVRESSVRESSVGESSVAEKIIQKEPAKSHSVLTTTNDKKFDKPDGTVCLRRSKRLQENLKDKDSYISA